jgi:chemotaxis protein methyltransferase CheR
MSAALAVLSNQDVELSKREFELFRALAYETSGLDFPDNKQQLVSTRLARNMRDLSITSFNDYYRYVTEDQTGVSLSEMIDALTTNHTSFAREPAHFEFLRRKILPGLRDRTRISIWSAACSSGEEPYSIAFTLADEGVAFHQMGILATDISTRVIETARKGIYPIERVEGIPPAQSKRYLVRGTSEWADWYLVRKEVRASIEFRQFNLMEKIGGIGPFPVIFCRNVMIYFDRNVQQGLVNRLSEHLEPGGYLFIGHSETLNGLDQPLEYVQAAVYRKPIAGFGRQRK